ncbi:MAG: hypothetical protein A2W26_04750 [Acidobacteria bacterium RBG_16_64_8]|nr:MAG: hypothetical protein A2W26_04750 [Acidobacteria bacterium RBG_16_64_8]
MPLLERLKADDLSLQTLVAANPDHLQLAYRAPDLRRFSVDARMDAPVATGSGYRIMRDHTLVIEIPDGYLSRDAGGLFTKSKIKRQGQRVFHPNVWPVDGAFCFDSQFHPAKSLAEQVWTAFELMQGRKVNHESPADWEADYLYLNKGEELLREITAVRLLLPRGGVRISTLTLPMLT